MPPYNPPVTHYSQLDVSHVPEEDMYAFIGRRGRRFYWLTRFLNLSYLWYNPKKSIEIWGPYWVHENRQAALVIEAELDNFLLNREKSKSEKEYVFVNRGRNMQVGESTAVET